MTSTEDGSKGGNAGGIFQASFETAGTRQSYHPLLSGIQSNIRDNSYSQSIPTTSQNTNNLIQLSNLPRGTRGWCPVAQGQLPPHTNLSSQCLTGWSHSQECQQMSTLTHQGLKSFYFCRSCSRKKENQFLQAAVQPLPRNSHTLQTSGDGNSDLVLS